MRGVSVTPISPTTYANYVIIYNPERLWLRSVRGLYKQITVYQALPGNLNMPAILLSGLLCTQPYQEEVERRRRRRGEHGGRLFTWRSMASNGLCAQRSGLNQRSTESEHRPIPMRSSLCARLCASASFVIPIQLVHSI